MGKKDARYHLEMMERTSSKITSLLAKTSSNPSASEITLFAIYLSELYFLIEEVMKCVAKMVGIEIPGGSQSHADLLALFRNYSSTGLPPLMPDLIAENCRGLMKFRHFCNHNYTVDLDWKLLQSHLSHYEQIVVEFRRLVLNFLDPKTPENSDGS